MKRNITGFEIGMSATIKGLAVVVAILCIATAFGRVGHFNKTEAYKQDIKVTQLTHEAKAMIAEGEAQIRTGEQEGVFDVDVNAVNDAVDTMATEYDVNYAVSHRTASFQEMAAAGRTDYIH